MQQDSIFEFGHALYYFLMTISYPGIEDDALVFYVFHFLILLSPVINLNLYVNDVIMVHERTVW